MKKLISLILVVVLFSCNKEKDFDCLKSTGAISTEERILPAFTKILLRENINLVFVPSASQRIVIEAGKNLIPKIITKVENDSLIIDNANYCNWMRNPDKEIKVYIYGNPGIKLYNKGYGTVSGRIEGSYFFIKSWNNANIDLDINLDYFWLETFKQGNTTLSGSVRNMEAFRHETGAVNMKAVSRCDSLIFHDHGQGISWIKAENHLSVRTYGSGNVICLTKPDVVNYEQKGTGTLSFE